jgi:hypothetical protein
VKERTPIRGEKMAYAKTYDASCLELAEKFLNNHDYPTLSNERRKELAHELAIDIQSTIEDFFNSTKIITGGRNEES